MPVQLPRTIHGFSLIEILVIISLLGVLATVVILNIGGSSAAARDTQRQSDLRNLQAAIETYKNENGRYPYQATSTAPGNNGWSGEIGTNFAPDDGSSQYIVGLAPAYISVLPTDPKLNGANSGYVYRTNGDGSSYKLKAHRTVESELPNFQHPFKACDIRVASNPSNGNLLSGSTNPEVIGWCGRVQFSGSSLPATCRSTNDDWRISFAVWGGFAPLFPTTLTSLASLTDNQKVSAIRNTTDVICR